MARGRVRAQREGTWLGATVSFHGRCFGCEPTDPSTLLRHLLDELDGLAECVQAFAHHCLGPDQGRRQRAAGSPGSPTAPANRSGRSHSTTLDTVDHSPIDGCRFVPTKRAPTSTSRRPPAELLSSTHATDCSSSLKRGLNSGRRVDRHLDLRRRGVGVARTRPLHVVLPVGTSRPQRTGCGAQRRCSGVRPGAEQ